MQSIKRVSTLYSMKVRSGMGAYAGAILRRYFLGLRLAIFEADARSAMPVSFR